MFLNLSSVNHDRRTTERRVCNRLPRHVEELVAKRFAVEQWAGVMCPCGIERTRVFIRFANQHAFCHLPIHLNLILSGSLRY